MTPHICDWTPTPCGDFACADCGATSPACIVTDTRRGTHPTGSSTPICDHCLKIEGYVLDDITDALTWWDERDRNPQRSPMAFSLVRVHGAPTAAGGIRYPEDVHHELLAWAIRWAAHTGRPADGEDTVAFLKSRHMWAATNPDTSRFHWYREHVRTVRHAARRVAGLTPDRHPEACMHCGGRIVQDRADHRWQPYPDGRQDTVRCTGCGLTWNDRTAFQRNVRHHIWELPLEHPDQLVTLDQAAQIFPDVPRSTFRYWIHEDRRSKVRQIPERGDSGGRALYRLGDLHAKVVARAEEGRKGRPARAADGRITA